MKTREQAAADIYGDGRDTVRNGGQALRLLAGHITAMVRGANTPWGKFDGPLWRVREFPDGPSGRVITLDRFEDYLLRPSREGLGIPSLLWLSRVLSAHEDKAERESALAAVRQEIPDFDALVEAERARLAVRSVEALAAPNARPGNQNARKQDDNAVDNINRVSNPKPSKGGTDPGYLTARLKRDAATDPKAQALLDSLAAGSLSARAAALQMGYLKTPGPAEIIERERAKLSAADQVKLWREWGRTLPAEALDPVAIAQEAFWNLHPPEQARFLAWARKAVKGAAA